MKYICEKCNQEYDCIVSDRPRFKIHPPDKNSSRFGRTEHIPVHIKDGPECLKAQLSTLPIVRDEFRKLVEWIDVNAINNSQGEFALINSIDLDNKIQAARRVLEGAKRPTDESSSGQKGDNNVN